jgi:hypothetical protein
MEAFLKVTLRGSKDTWENAELEAAIRTRIGRRRKDLAGTEYSYQTEGNYQL